MPWNRLASAGSRLLRTSAVRSTFLRPPPRTSLPPGLCAAACLPPSPGALALGRFRLGHLSGGGLLPSPPAPVTAWGESVEASGPPPLSGFFCTP